MTNPETERVVEALGCGFCNGTGIITRDRWSMVLGTTVPDDCACRCTITLPSPRKGPHR